MAAGAGFPRRAGDPGRYVSDRPIPGFPHDITTLVSVWNARFAIDLFTTRAVIADLSAASVAAVERSVARGVGDVCEIAKLGGSQRFFAFFHDDDDFFAPDIFARLAGTDCRDHDTCVFPLDRIGAEVFTFARPAMIGATVKTPASAPQLRALRAESGVMAEQFGAFNTQVDQLAFPPGHEWPSDPLRIVARLLKSGAKEQSYDQVTDLIENSFASFSKRSASFLSTS